MHYVVRLTRVLENNLDDDAIRAFYDQCLKACTLYPERVPEGMFPGHDELWGAAFCPIPGGFMIYREEHGPQRPSGAPGDLEALACYSANPEDPNNSALNPGVIVGAAVGGALALRYAVLGMKGWRAGLGFKESVRASAKADWDGLQAGIASCRGRCVRADALKHESAAGGRRDSLLGRDRDAASSAEGYGALDQVPAPAALV